jgi:hypothetical protein
MSIQFHYVIGQFGNNPPVLIHTFDNREDAYELLGALQIDNPNDAYYYVSIYHPDDIIQT